MKSIRPTLCAMTLLLLYLASTSTVNAASTTGYPCDIQFIPAGAANAGFGDHGYFQVVIEAGINCKGLTTGYFNFCSTNATHSQCTSNSHYHYDGETLHMLFTELLGHMHANQRVVINFASSAECDYKTCGHSIRFRAD